MSPEEFAFIRLASGFMAFFGLLFVLRAISKKMKPKPDESHWVGQDELTLVQVNAETHNIKTFVFQRANEKCFPPFRAGQFLSFQIGDDPKQIRSYSISSSELNRQKIQVSIKRIDGGIGSVWFHNLQVGSKVLSSRPSGHFIEPTQNIKKRVYIAGGIGITPVLSMIRTNIDKNSSLDMTLLYGVRTEKDLAFHTYLTQLSQKYDLFKYYPILSHEPDWPGEKGFIDIHFVKSKIHNLNTAIYFICGPEVMTDPLIKNLLQTGVNEADIYNEQFASPALLDESKITIREARININGKQLHYNGRQNLLAFLEGNGIPLPYACRVGVCGTCKCKITGPVKVLTHSGLTPKERVSGWALSCVAYPEGDITVESIS